MDPKESMDPNANLEEQLQLARSIVNEDHADAWKVDLADRLAELVIALDEAIFFGHNLPKRWQGMGPPSAYAPPK